jgi:hypothetical protein
LCFGAKTRQSSKARAKQEPSRRQVPAAKCCVLVVVRRWKRSSSLHLENTAAAQVAEHRDNRWVSLQSIQWKMRMMEFA